MARRRNRNDVPAHHAVFRRLRQTVQILNASRDYVSSRVATIVSKRSK